MAQSSAFVGSGRVRRVGLVLSGGGTYGAFQAGLLQVLKAEGLRFPLAVGSSIGALNALLAADDRPDLLATWSRLPVELVRESRLADHQWRQLLRAFADAEQVGRSAGEARFRSNVMRAAAAGTVAGAAVGVSASMVAGAKAGALGFGLLGAAVGAGAGLIGAWLLSEDDARDAGEEAARRYLNGVLREFGSAPFLSVEAVDCLKLLAKSARPAGKALATVAECSKFSARHVLEMRANRSTEVISKGSYLDLNTPDAAEVVIASMALPLVLGRGNHLNPSQFLDGGLYDNVPFKALAPAVKANEIDFLLVVDVSQSVGAFRMGLKSLTLDDEVPVLYVSLARPPGIAGMREMLNFDMAPDLFALGQEAGRAAMVKWFSRTGFDPADSWKAKSSTLPEAHVLQFRHEGAVPRAPVP